jgi:predicted nucleic acid-binding protein
MVIIDSSVIIDFLSGRINAKTSWLRRQPDLERMGITTLILSEVLQGIRDEEIFAETLAILSQFMILETGGRDLAIDSARNYRALRKRGITVRSTIDCITATFCINEEHELLHNDRDFDPFEEHLELVVVHPEILN